MLYDLAHMPLTKWNQIKSELIEMWGIVKAGQKLNLIAAKRSG
jgi:hypothetical protein